MVRFIPSSFSLGGVGNSFTVPGGQPLQPNMRYYVKVIAYGPGGAPANEILWSDAIWFETAP